MGVGHRSLTDCCELDSQPQLSLQHVHVGECGSSELDYLDRQGSLEDSSFRSTPDGLLDRAFLGDQTGDLSTQEQISIGTPIARTLTFPDSDSDLEMSLAENDQQNGFIEEEEGPMHGP